MEKWDGIIGPQYRPRPQLAKVTAPGQTEARYFGPCRTLDNQPAERDGKRLRAEVGPLPYQNWINPQGSLVQLPVKTTRQWRENQRGQQVPVNKAMDGADDEGANYRTAITWLKERAGWICVEPPLRFPLDYYDPADKEAGKEHAPRRIANAAELIEVVNKLRAAHAAKTSAAIEAATPVAEKLLVEMRSQANMTATQHAAAMQQIADALKSQTSATPKAAGRS